MTFAGRFRDKVMVVTGAAQGIGRGVALRAAAEGASMLLVDRAGFVSDVAREAGASARHFVCDLETYDGAAAAIAEAGRERGRPDIQKKKNGDALTNQPMTA